VSIASKIAHHAGAIELAAQRLDKSGFPALADGCTKAAAFLRAGLELERPRMLEVIENLRHQLAAWVEIADDEDDRQEDHDAITAADAILAGKTPAIETPRMLVLSTAHISESTNDMFDFNTDDVPQFFPKHPWGSPSEGLGWLIPIVGNEPFPHTCPEDLRAIRALAEANGCTWIMLDRDADVVDGLPIYEW
jgi:hypothetical protein